MSDPTSEWKVERHSGRSGDGWKERGRGDGVSMHNLFYRLGNDLRQGGVRLVAPDGTSALISTPCVVREGACKVNKGEKCL